jgi:hypothetical protein
VIGDDGDAGGLTGEAVNLAHAGKGRVAELGETAQTFAKRGLERGLAGELRPDSKHLQPVAGLLVEAENPVP